MSPAGTAAIDYARPLEFGRETFEHVIRSGPAARDDLAARFAAMDAGVFILVTTEGIPEQIVQDARYCLGQSAPVPVIPVTLPDGEEHKTLRSIEKIGVAAQDADASRKPVIVVGLGGGGVLNMAAYFARDWGRGDEVKVVYLPTNLLAWADMSPTRKTSVNLADGDGRLVGRNKIGSRITPSFVWTDAAWFRSLPPAQVRSGIGEVIKAMIAITPERTGELEAVLREDARYELDELAWIGGLCVEAKQQVMRYDPDEKAEAYVLHSGHEIGYQAELAHGIPHGLAISVGCLVAHRVAEDPGVVGLDSSVRELHAALLRKAGISTAFPASASPEKLVRGLYRGSARGIIDPRPGYVDLVLLQGLGNPSLTYVPRMGRSVPLTQVREDIVIQAVRDIQAAA